MFTRVCSYIGRCVWRSSVVDGLALRAIAPAALVLAVGCQSPGESTDTVRLGLMLPYTGDLSSTSRNHERAVLLVKRQIGSVGLAGRELDLVFADSHSELERGISAAERLLEQEVAAVIGFESDELAAALLPRLEEEGVVLITPSVSASSVYAGSQPWLRVAPSSKSMAENLAKELFARGTRSVAVLRAKDQYNTSFAAAFIERMTRLGGSVPSEVIVDVNRRSYPEALDALEGQRGIVLAVPAEVGARVVNEFYAEGVLPQWFLSPALRSENFVLNTSPRALKGALGVAPNVEVESAFAKAFSDSFQGDRPLDSALFYYDAVALFALAYEHAYSAAGGRQPSAEQMVSSLFAAAFPVGVETTWKDLPEALSDLRQGKPRYYRGLTGRIALAADGERGVGVAKFWGVSEIGAIVDLD